ncbi:hypothetical protein [Siphonobacter sp. SORGH_AS_0500]|uniref:hypothetical protein n=1 Tax=Siphonobacter sp. SORGH_AS_0500 TaxID=1864824 RepID=UPI00285AA71F|nr:hypothetical protein [Siphonobacter sp. SORGH_AS_0500]MDR6195191.1 hypothetical protein [Siphonobacter sp. SORGH_AS_0500]
MLISVPVRPHIKQYFQSEAAAGSEPIEVRRNSRIGQIFTAIFAVYPLHDVDMESLEPNELLDARKLHLFLTFDVNPQLITDARLSQLGQVLEVLFETSAIAFCKGRMDVFNSANGAAERFCQVHKITPAENYTPDAVRKLVSRSTPKSSTIREKLSVTEKRQIATYSEELQIGSKKNNVQVSA